MEKFWPLLQPYIWFLAEQHQQAYQSIDTPKTNFHRVNQSLSLQLQSPHQRRELDWDKSVSSGRCRAINDRDSPKNDAHRPFHLPNEEIFSARAVPLQFVLFALLVEHFRL